MNIDGVENGIVLDHIQAGKSMEVYRLLQLDKLDCSVAVIQNAKSTKYGKKDIIKIDEMIHLDMDILGYIDPNITINLVENNRLIQKSKTALPEKLTNVISCKNPRCITSIEQEIQQIFYLADEEKQIYRCMYCDVEYS
ncbi:MAG: aspartate carbamoyltransferase regulatory subunit [Anaerovoracaceae bacterium]|jgi:aspartate carbamoyltransferase regulatory subunit